MSVGVSMSLGARFLIGFAHFSQISTLDIREHVFQYTKPFFESPFESLQACAPCVYNGE